MAQVTTLPRSPIVVPRPPERVNGRHVEVQVERSPTVAPPRSRPAPERRVLHNFRPSDLSTGVELMFEGFSDRGHSWTVTAVRARSSYRMRGECKNSDDVVYLSDGKGGTHSVTAGYIAGSARWSIIG